MAKYILFSIFYSILSFSIEVKSNDLKSIINFADLLSLNRDYRNALHEYKRAFFFAGSDQKCQLSAKIADCYFVLGEFKPARTFYDSALHYSTHDSVRIDHAFQKALCYMMENNFGYALLKLNGLEVGTHIHLQRRKSLYQGICYFGMEQYDSSYQHLLNSIPQTDTLKITQLQQLYKDRKKLKRPNSNAATILSIVVPGSGQLYSGDIKDGLNSFLLLGGLFYLGASSSIIGPVIILPFFYRYYMGGIVHAGEAAEERREEKRYEYYSNLTGYSQVISDTSSLKTLFIPELHTEDHSTYLENSESEMKVLISFSFLFYKEFISSQDVEACVFQPSCSKYTIEAVEKKGVIIGLLDGLDRLLRCHSFVNERDYPFNTHTKKYHDPH